MQSVCLKVSVQDKLEKRQTGEKETEQRLFSHEVNKTLDQNKTRNGEERVNPREFSKEEAIRLLSNGVESKRQVKDDSNCHNHGGWITVSKAYSNPVDPFLEEARAIPHPCSWRMTVLSA